MVTMRLRKLWASWNHGQRIIASAIATLEVGIACACLAVFSSRGPGSNTAQWAFGAVAVFLIASAVVCGLGAAAHYEWKD